MIFLTLLIFPIFIALGFKIFGSTQVTVKEFVAQMAAQMVVAGISVAVILYANTTDYETWNGRITGKEKDRVSCSHSYDCNCRQVESCSGSGKNRSCSSSRVCDTCYEHSWDYDWDIHTSNRETFSIRRVDRQGVHMPPRWNKAKIGDPTAITHSYDNYVKAAPDSLFAMHGLVEEFKGQLPEHPSKIYDYHYINRAVGNMPDKPEWNRQLMELNADIGSTKQANIIIVSTPTKDSRFSEALNQYWLGGSKNDIVVMVHAEAGKVVWARVMAWSNDDLVKIKIRDELLDVDFTPASVLPIVRKNVMKHYTRKPMKDFEYLKDTIKPSKTQWIVSNLIGFLVSVILGFVFWKHDVFNEERGYRSYRRF